MSVLSKIPSNYMQENFIGFFIFTNDANRKNIFFQYIVKIICYIFWGGVVVAVFKFYKHKGDRMAQLFF